VADEPTKLTFTVAVDDIKKVEATLDSISLVEDSGAQSARRSYVTVIAQRRLHQQAFRERVLRAYGRQCALCRLKHTELLDAAHITADSDLSGEPITTNGLALCKLHHAAFDRDFLAVTPDYVVKIRADLMDETDGPMLRHGLQGLNGGSIILPRAVAHRPDRDRLAERYQNFLAKAH
jgi:putative restriction endonuclease